MKKDYYISSQYCFCPQNDLEVLQQQLLSFLKTHRIMGTFLIAKEGINGTVCSESKQSITQLQQYLKNRYPEMAFKNSYAHQETPPFYRRKVMIKKEIVSMGEPDLPVHQRTGQRIDPTYWNDIIQHSDVQLIDTRNQYEYDIGSFKGAMNPKIDSFLEFKNYVSAHCAQDKPVAIFCTGGIRCEKASTWMLEAGYKRVYQLDGGILNYLENVEPSQSLWEGQCFVFDNRVAVNHALEPGDYELCHGCRHPIAPSDKQDRRYAPGVSCPHCYNRITAQQKVRFEERHKQVQLAKKRGQTHIGNSSNQ